MKNAFDLLKDFVENYKVTAIWIDRDIWVDGDCGKFTRKTVKRVNILETLPADEANLLNELIGSLYYMEFPGSDEKPSSKCKNHATLKVDCPVCTHTKYRSAKNEFENIFCDYARSNEDRLWVKKEGGEGEW